MPTILSDKPTTKIVISSNEITGYKKQTDAIEYYLLNGTEFALKLTNPKSYIRLKARIYINGEYIGSDIVLDKKETTVIERFIETSKKFKFESYQVDKNPTVDFITQNNGKIIIEWYKEKTYVPNTHDLVYRPYYDFLWDPNRTPVITCNINQSKNWLATGSNFVAAELHTISTSYSITTGVINQGSDSNQTFNEEGDVEFEPICFHRERIDLLDASLKSDHAPGKAKAYYETKVYCGKCGRRMKDKNWTFCPGCGNRF